MIKPEKVKSALSALQAILVRARFMAQTKEPHEDIAMLMDYAEYLPQLFLSEEDMTEMYRKCLQGAAERFPFSRPALELFDGEPPEKL